MATFCYDSFLTDVMTGAVQPGLQSYACMLLTDAYTPDMVNHAKRSDVNAAEVTGAAGYTAGGVAITMTGSFNPTTNQYTMTFSSPNWNSSSIMARYAAIYVSRGGAASADNLVALVDFGMDWTSTNGTFTVLFSTPLTWQK